MENFSVWPKCMSCMEINDSFTVKGCSKGYLIRMDVNIIITRIMIHQLERDSSIPSLMCNTLPLSIEEKGMKNQKINNIIYYH